MENLYYTIGDLRGLYPDLEYIDGELFVGDELICDTQLTKRMIEDHYDGWEVTKAHHSGDPQQEYLDVVDGTEYIEYQFDGDYEEAYNFI